MGRVGGFLGLCMHDASAVDAKPLDRRLQNVPYPSPYDMAVAGLGVMRYSLRGLNCPRLVVGGEGSRRFRRLQLHV